MTAFADMLVREMPRLRAYARSLTKDYARADDLLQDTLLKAWEARDSFTLGTNLKAWTSTIMVRAFLHQRRAQKHRNHAAMHEVSEKFIRVDGAQDAALRLREVQRSIGKLNPDFQAVFFSAIVLGMDTQETAEKHNIPEGTVRSRLFRAREELRAL